MANQGARTDIPEKSPESLQPIETRKEIAKSAGVSTNTLAKAKVLAEKANEDVKDKLRKGETTIHREFQASGDADPKGGCRLWGHPPETVVVSPRVWLASHVMTQIDTWAA